VFGQHPSGVYALARLSQAVRMLLVAGSRMLDGPPEVALDTRSSIRQVRGKR
jgi:hypothetical protein